MIKNVTSYTCGFHRKCIKNIAFDSKTYIALLDKVFYIAFHAGVKTIITY